MPQRYDVAAHADDVADVAAAAITITMLLRYAAI